MEAEGSAKGLSQEREDEETFTEEIKDYAKSTMNELLGIFGYDDQISEEAVEDLAIQVSPTGNLAPKPVQQIPTKAAPSGNSQVTMDGTRGPLPVIVKVEGSAGGSKLVNQDETKSELGEANSKVSAGVTEEGNANINASAPLVNHPQRPGGHRASDHQQWIQASKNPSTTGIVVTYKDTANVPLSNPVGPCSWCKKVGSLQDFTLSDGEKDVACTGMCSALCFEQAVKNISQSQMKPANLSGKPINAGSSGAGGCPAPCNANFWDEYLKENNAKAAPWSCFKQATTPPYNGFKPGMKLEVRDPRIVNTTCLVTVVAAVGSRIRCRFDGTDSANDVWHMVDSREIHPLGWCEGNGGALQPPMGFKFDAGKYPTFLSKALLNANPAPVRLFKREPPGPQENHFKPGQKLEALDPKNPALICVATVAELADDRIRVEFDGYLGTDYWYRYDSRDLFPANWCLYSGHPLQPPGTSKKALRASQKPEKPDRPDKPGKKDPQPSSSHQPTSTAPEPASPPRSPSLSPCPAPEAPVGESRDSQATTSTTVQVYINHSCKVGPYLDPVKVARLPECYRGAVGNVTKDCIQAVVNAALDVKTVIGFLKTGHGKTKITAKCGRQTYSCVLQHIDRVAIFWRVLERFSDSLKCCENLFCGEKLEGECEKCGGKQGGKTSETKVRRSSATPPTHPTPPRLTPPRPTPPRPTPPRPTPAGRSSAKRQHSSTSNGRSSRKVSKITIDDDDISSPQVCSTSPPKTWTVDEVVKYIEGSELAYISDLIKKHEIDGKALLLLTREMIMSYMGLKLGPAIKLLDIIDELKSRKTPT